MTARRKPGRPPRSSRPAAERIELRVTAAERKRWERAAGKQPLSEWIRLACERFAALG